MLASLRDELKQAMRDRNEPKKNALRLVIAEIERLPEKDSTDLKRQQSVIRKLIEGNKETLPLLPEGDARIATLTWENEFLSGLLPKTLSVEEIKIILNEVVDKIIAAKSDGQATGEAMKHLKAKNAEVQGGDVQIVVKEIRGS